MEYHHLNLNLRATKKISVLIHEKASNDDLAQQDGAADSPTPELLPCTCPAGAADLGHGTCATCPAAAGQTLDTGLVHWLRFENGADLKYDSMTGASFGTQMHSTPPWRRCTCSCGITRAGSRGQSAPTPSRSARTVSQYPSGSRSSNSSWRRTARRWARLACGRATKKISVLIHEKASFVTNKVKQNTPQPSPRASPPLLVLLFGSFCQVAAPGVAGLESTHKLRIAVTVLV